MHKNDKKRRRLSNYTKTMVRSALENFYKRDEETQKELKDKWTNQYNSPNYYNENKETADNYLDALGLILRITRN